MNLTRVAITRPIFMFMLLIGAILMGTLSYVSMRKELNPEVSFGVVSISTVYRGANPEEVATLVSRPIEEAVSGVNGIQTVTSNSLEGVSVVVIQFEIGTNLDAALSDVRAKIDAAVPNLPTDVDKPTVAKLDTTSEPVVYYAVSASRLESRDLRTLLDDKLKDRFSRIPGVAEVSVQGGDIREIQVRVKRDQLMKYSVGLADVQRAIASATLNVPGGKLVQGDEEFSVRVPGEFKTVDDIRKLIFTIQNPGNPDAKSRLVRLGDVAQIEDTIQERTSFSRLNGEETIVLVVQKAREGNTVDVVNAADGVVRQLVEENKAVGLKFVKTQDQSTQINESLLDLNFALVFGIVLVSAIVYLFLHNLRGTLIVIIAIPACIFGTFIALQLAGFTVNNLTMLALTLAVGVLVDDAIVVLENIYRHLRMGESPREAAINGRSEIGLAAIAITLADVVVFLPLAFVGGIVGQFFRPLALGYVFAVLMSLFVSFTLTPMLASRWYRAGEDMEHPTGRFAQAFERWFGGLERGYRRILEWSLANRWFVFIAGNVVLFAVFMLIAGSRQASIGEAFQVGIRLFIVSMVIGALAFGVNLLQRRFTLRPLWGAALFGLLFPLSTVAGFALQQWKGEDLFKFSFFPDSDAGQININVQLPPGRSLEATDQVMRRVENAIKDHPDIKYLLSSIGTQGAGTFNVGNQGSNYGQVVVSLHEKVALMDSLMPWVKHDEPLRSQSANAVSAELLKRIGRVPGAEIRVAATDNFGAGGAIQISFAGDDRQKILETVSNIKRRLQSGAIPGVINPDISSKPGKPEIQAEPDRVRLADAGLTVSDLATSMRIAYTGDDSPKFRQAGREYVIRTMLDLEDRDNPNLIGTIPIRFVQGEPVTLAGVAKLQPGIGTDRIERRNREEEIRLTTDLLPGFAAGSVNAHILAWMNRENLVPEGVRIKPLGQAESQNREGAGLVIALFLGLALVYMVLASLYDNLLYPFIIQLAQPQAFVGALLALIITNKAFNLIGFIGLITLIGLVGKNAILLVDYTNTLRGRGRSRHEAIVEAGPVRLRPILMTTLALVLGTLPVALAIGRGSEFRETIGIVIIGGIALSTILTLVVIPCSYTIFDDLSNWFARRRGRPTSDEEYANGRGVIGEAPAEPTQVG